MKRVFVVCALLAAACTPAAPPPVESEAVDTVATTSAVTLIAPTVRPPFGGQTTAAGFVTIKNTSAEPDRLISASSPNAKSIELHTHIDRDGAKSMVRIEAIDVPVGGEAVLQPGGLHLMLFNFTAPASGAPVPVQLVFEKAGTVSAEFAVANAATTDSMPGMKH